MSEARAPHLDEDILAIRTALARIEERLQHVAPDVEVAAITAALPFLATKADLAKAPTRGEMWAMLATMTGAFAVILTALTFLQHWLK